MRLLVLSPVCPDAPTDGDRLRLYHWLEALGRRHEVQVACFADPDRPGDGLDPVPGPRLAAVHRVAWPRRRRRLAALARLPGALPSGVAAMACGAMRALVASLTRTGAPFDAVLAYRLKMAPYALAFRGPRFLDYTDSMTRYGERRAAELSLRGRRLAAALARLEAGRLAAYEAWCAGHFDAGFFNARRDCEAVQAMNPRAASRLRVAANGVDLESFRPPRAGARPAAGPRSGPELLFAGHLAYAPNADAVAWFVREVLPRVRERVPGAFLTVLGGDAAPGLSALGRLPGVRFEGFVADTRPYLWRAAVSVCPVRTGAGRQNKLLEAFAAGLPAVATHLAAEGAEARDGREVLAATRAPDFAQAVLRLLQGASLRRRLALGAQSLARRAYRWPANAAVLENAMLEATRRPLW